MGSREHKGPRQGQGGRWNGNQEQEALKEATTPPKLPHTMGVTVKVRQGGPFRDAYKRMKEEIEARGRSN